MGVPLFPFLVFLTVIPLHFASFFVCVCVSRMRLEFSLLPLQLANIEDGGLTALFYASSDSEGQAQVGGARGSGLKASFQRYVLSLAHNVCAATPLLVSTGDGRALASSGLSSLTSSLSSRCLLLLVPARASFCTPSFKRWRPARAWTPARACSKSPHARKKSC